MSLASGSTAFSNNSAKLLSERSILTPPSHLSNERSPPPSSKNYTDVMMERYNNYVKNLPEPDQQDVLVQHMGMSQQLCPEFSHEVYLHMRRIENCYLTYNYLSGGMQSKTQTIDDSGRTYGVQRIMQLCTEKGYKQETMYLAINVFDKILSLTFKTFKRE